MPELPDVETFRRYLGRTARNKKIAAVEIDGARMRHGIAAGTIRDAMTGREFGRTRRHGKYLFAELGADSWLVLHFGMTGYLDYAKDGAAPPDHTRLLVRFANGARLAGVWQRLLGRIALTDDPDDFIEDEKLGPDALSLGRKDFTDMLAGRGGTIKGALMDQSFVAGLGNVYSDEMLYQARLHPRTPAKKLGADGAAALHRAMGHVLKTAIARKADPARLPDRWLLPHRAAGAKCPRCGGKIARIAISGRHAFVCPHCQKA